MPTKTRNERQAKHVKFTNNRQFLGVPQFLVEQALRIRIGDDKLPIYFTVKVLRNNGMRLVLVPSKRPLPETKPFKGWKSNNESRRYYISAIAILKALKLRKSMVGEVSLPSTVEDGKIIATVPVLLRQDH